MNRHILYGFSVIALLGGLIHSAAFGAARFAGADNPAFIDYGKGQVNSEYLLARLRGNIDQVQFNRVIEKTGLKVVREFTLVPGLKILAMPKAPAGVAGDENRLNKLLATRRSLEASGLFRYVELDYVHKPLAKVTDSAFVDGTLWALENVGQDNGTRDADIDIEQAWEVTSGSPETVVAVIDTGVRVTHNDLIDQIWTNEDEIPNNGIDDDMDGYVDNYKGVDFYNNDGNPDDVHGHGTHCSGTIAASANDDNPHVGVAFSATILPCKVGDFGMPQSAIIAAIQFCVAEGVKIANCSYGGYFGGQAEYDAYAAAGVEGMIFLAAAGNDANDNDSLPMFPSSFDLECIVSVAATDRDDNITSFSNYGATAVDLGAPGLEIFSCTATNDQSYESWAGTSMAAPHVTGVVALMRSLRPDWTVLQVREKLLNSTDPIMALDGKTVTGGRLNAAKAVADMGTFGLPDGIMEVSITPPSGSLLMAGDKISIVVEVIDGEKVENAVVTMLMEDGNTAFFSNDGEFPDVVDGDNLYTSYFKVPEEQGKLKMTLFVSSEGKEDAIRVIQYNIADIPENDNFMLAEKIPEKFAIVEAFNTFATIERNEPRHSGLAMHFASLWWKWTAENSGSVFVDTAGSDVDTNIAVYQGNDIGELLLVERNQNHTVEERDKGIYFNAVSGKTYKFCVSSPVEENLGYIRLRVAPGGKPDINKPFLSGIQPFNGFITKTNKIEIRGFAHDPVPNASGVKEVRARVNDGLFSLVVGTREWFTPVALLEGENIIELVAVDYSDNISESVRLQYDYFPPDLTNDHFVNASELNLDVVLIRAGQSRVPLTRGVGDIEQVVVKRDGVPMEPGQYHLDPENNGILELVHPVQQDARIEVFNPFWTSATVSTLKATKEHQEPDHAGNEGGGSVWYRFQAPYDGVLTIDILESGFDTLLAMYMGSTVGDLTGISSNDDAFTDDELEFDPGISQLTQALEQGMMIYLAVDGYGGERGNVAIRSLFKKDAVHRLMANANGTGSIVSPYQPFTDGSIHYALYRQNETVTVEAVPADGGRFFGWSGDVNVSDNKFNLTISDEFHIQANFVENRGVYGFEDWKGEDFRWSTGGGAPWVLEESDPFQGRYSMRTGKIGDLQHSFISFRGNFNAGEVSFALRVSSENDWDRLSFSLDDQLVGTWSGVVDWKIVGFPVSPGSHTLTWEYKKDFANSANLDAAWLDEISLPLSIAASLKGIQHADRFELLVKGEPLHRYEIWSSRDLRDWQELQTLKLDSSGEASLFVPNKQEYHFYKIRIK